MRFNHIWASIRNTLSILLGIDQRISELDRRLKSVEIEANISPGNDESQSVDIIKERTKVSGRID